MLRLAVAIQADGYYEKNCDGILFQFAKLRKIERLEDILDNLGLKYSKHRINNGKNEGQYKIRILAGHGIPNYKNLPFEWIYQSNKHQKELLIEEIKKWDGHEEPSGFSEYYTVNEYQATWVNTLARMSGIISSLVKREINRDGNRDIYRVTFPGKRDVMTTQKLKRVEVPYSGKVHCVSVSSTMFWVRMNGCISLTGNTHPDLFPTMERETLSSSILTHYKDVKGIPRDNYYELISSNASSIRSSTLNVLVEDEVCFYTHPEQLQDAILPSMPDYGFSLVIYLSTVSDKKSTFFLDKIKTARDNPEDWSLIFVPWYFTYPERKVGIDSDSLILDDYEKDVILPAMQKDNIPKERWGDCIDWYRRRRISGVDMMREYPTTLDEVLTMGEDEKVFGTETLQKQEKNIEDRPYYKLVTDNLTGKVEAKESEDETPLKIYRSPVYGRRYRLTVDPITAQSDNTDFFSMSMWDIQSHEQMAVFHGRGFSDDDYADQAVCMARIYNNAEICPEINVASGFIAGVNNRRYYRWFYANEKARKNKEIGLRTTVSSKEKMIDQLKTLLDREIIVIHDRDTLDELNNFVKKVRLRSDGSRSIYMAAKGKTHDDLCFTAILYAGSLDQRQLEQRKRSGFALAW